MSHSTTCLNCEEKLNGNFCSNCGQKSDTHRITLKHFLFHDVLHGVWHIDKGILFTIKQAIIRPGQAALDYISGKRIKYYNVFYLILILIGLNIFLSNQYDKMAHTYFGTIIEPETNEKGKAINDFIINNSKLIIFSFVPLFAINSFILFRRKKLNISEHFIIAGMVYLGVLFFVTAIEILSFLEFIKYINIITDYINFILVFGLFVYIVFSYYNAFKFQYSKASYAFRISLFTLFLTIEIVFLILLLLGYITKWKGGEIELVHH
jgi:hypothetical protein